MELRNDHPWWNTQATSKNKEMEHIESRRNLERKLIRKSNENNGSYYGTTSVSMSQERRADRATSTDRVNNARVSWLPTALGEYEETE